MTASNSMVLRRVAVAAVLAGFVLGVGGRIVMRLIALEAGLEGSGTWGGTLEVLALGTILGTPVALLFLYIRHRVTWRAPWPGVWGGIAFFAVLATLPPPSARSALSGTPDTPAFTGLAFLLLLVGWMVGLDYLSPRLRRA